MPMSLAPNAALRDARKAASSSGCNRMLHLLAAGLACMANPQGRRRREVAANERHEGAGGPAATHEQAATLLPLTPPLRRVSERLACLKSRLQLSSPSAGGGYALDAAKQGLWQGESCPTLSSTVRGGFPKSQYSPNARLQPRRISQGQRWRGSTPKHKADGEQASARCRVVRRFARLLPMSPMPALLRPLPCDHHELDEPHAEALGHERHDLHAGWVEGSKKR